MKRVKEWVNEWPIGIRCDQEGKDFWIKMSIWELYPFEGNKLVDAKFQRKRLDWVSDTKSLSVTSWLILFERFSYKRNVLEWRNETNFVQLVPPIVGLFKLGPLASLFTLWLYNRVMSKTKICAVHNQQNFKIQIFKR